MAHTPTIITPSAEAVFLANRRQVRLLLGSHTNQVASTRLDLVFHRQRAPDHLPLPRHNCLESVSFQPHRGLLSILHIKKLYLGVHTCFTSKNCITFEF